MAPKRKQPSNTARTASANTTATKRRSKLAKENDISAEDEAEILEAFNLFALQNEDNIAVIKTSELRRCLVALNAPPSSKEEMQELISVADAEAEGVVDWEHFLPVAALKLNQRGIEKDEKAMNEEVQKAYRLFTGGEDRPITLQDLQRVARDLREEVPDNVLRDMLREASGGGIRGVGLEDFAAVMKRAGVFG